MSQVNLLPPELRERQRVRRTTSLVALGGVGVLVLVGAFYFLQMQRLSDVEGDLAAQQDRNNQLRGQIFDLQRFADLQAQLAERQQLVATLFVNEVSWSAALLDVSRVIPDASYLTSLTGQITPPALTGEPAAPADAETTLIGNMNFQGVARETETIATWLTRLEQIQGWVNPWVSSAQQDAPFSRIYSFSSGLDLTVSAATERGRGVQP
ncbi:MAG TPA: PilN domain-containing protein [Actinomycetota bacterium]|nr:PilN domain-containing protein [Actinomycetota bacterium]